MVLHSIHSARNSEHIIISQLKFFIYNSNSNQDIITVLSVYLVCVKQVPR